MSQSFFFFLTTGQFQKYNEVLGGTTDAAKKSAQQHRRQVESLLERLHLTNIRQLVTPLIPMRYLSDYSMLFYELCTFYLFFIFLSGNSFTQAVAFSKLTPSIYFCTSNMMGLTRIHTARKGIWHPHFTSPEHPTSAHLSVHHSSRF